MSLVPRVLTQVTHVTPPLDRPTSGYKFSSVGNYIQSSKVSLHVRLKDGHYPDEMPQWEGCLRGPKAAMPPWKPLGDASQPDARCLRGTKMPDALMRGHHGEMSCQSTQMGALDETW